MTKKDFKKCKIDYENYKIKIIKFIIEFRKFFKQNDNLFNKWRNKNMEIKGCNYSDFSDLSP